MHVSTEFALIFRFMLFVDLRKHPILVPRSPWHRLISIVTVTMKIEKIIMVPEDFSLVLLRHITNLDLIGLHNIVIQLFNSYWTEC